MSLTHINCHLFRGKNASIDSSSYVALNPAEHPGSLVLAGSCAAKDSIASQVACRLCLEHFVRGLTDFFEKLRQQNGARSHDAQRLSELSQEALEAAFRNANSSVYNFGHKLAAGGRMAATLIGLVIEGGVISTGRAGGGSAYLYRHGELFPFFESKHLTRLAEQSLDSYVGANSLVSVELASVPTQAADVIFLFSLTLDPLRERTLSVLASELDLSMPNVSRYLAQQLFEDAEDVAFALTADLGPDTIYLSSILG